MGEYTGISRKLGSLIDGAKDITKSTKDSISQVANSEMVGKFGVGIAEFAKNTCEKTIDFAVLAGGAVERIAKSETVENITNGAVDLVKTAGERTLGGVVEMAKTNMAKDVAAGALAGAAVAVPVPVIGPPIGALAGAAIGIYKNLGQPSNSLGGSNSRVTESGQSLSDVPEQIMQYSKLKNDGVLTEKEFEEIKKKLITTVLKS